MRQVALIYDARRSYDLKVMTGVAAYLKDGAGWNIYIEESSLKDQRLPDLRSWQGDGIIADFDDPLVTTAVLKSRLPAVAFGSGYGWYDPNSSIPYFFTNNESVAQLAADHLLGRGFRHFAFCGYPRTAINGWSEERERAFSKHVIRRGFSCHVYESRYKTSRKWTAIQRSLANWLKSLPKPIGLMAANDNRARQVLEACRACELPVPAEVAVVGVDNDELLCQLSTPLLSSIEQGAKRIGYEAAVLLERMMTGEQPVQRRFVIDPVEVVTRGSTNILAIQDPKVAEAMAFIYKHVCAGLKVHDVAKAVASSYSGLEAHFKAALGRPIHVAIREAKLEYVRRLIYHTNLSLKQIAGDTGFRSVQHMTAMYGRVYGHSPAAQRREVNGFLRA